MSPTRRICGALGALFFVALATGCSSGGGGGGAGSAPRLVRSVFLGATATPAAGDELLLSFSGPIQLVSSAVLDDEDFVFGGAGTTLGTPTSPPAVEDGNNLRIVLGAGVDIVPGTTQLSFSEDFDAIAGGGSALATSEVPVAVTAGDGDDPVITSFTLNGVDSTLNGTGPAMGVLQVPRNGFEIDLTFTDSTLELSDVVITASVPVVETGGTTFAPGESLTDFLRAVSSTGGPGLPPGQLRFIVGDNLTFGFGDVTLTAQVADLSGRVSEPVDFSFRTTNANSQNRPFEATQLWFIDISRDLESFTENRGAGPTRIGFGFDVVDMPNGRSDFEDAMQALGLQGAMPETTDATVRDRLLSEVIDELAVLFEGVDIQFTTTSPGTFPGGNVPFSGSTFSQICFGGAATAGGSGTLGAAIIDRNNARQDDNCDEEFMTSDGDVRLGVFLHTIADVGVNSGLSSDFVQAVRPFAPIFDILTPTPTPIGDDPNDAARLAGTMNDARKTQIDEAIATVARVVAVVAAHECGHSMGLVINGPMPSGLYGGDRTNFPLTNVNPSANPADLDALASNHIENSVGFEGPAQNVMSPAIGIDAAIEPLTRFNSLNISYLREQSLYNPQ